MAIILVGNGPSVLDKKNGEIIDSFGEVVRFNWYHIEGYEEYVGTRTDIWFTSVYTGYGFNRAAEKYKVVYRHSWEWDPAEDKIYNELLKYDNPIIKVEEKEVLEIRKYMGKENSYYYYSSGAIAINIFLKQYDKLTLTGFDWWEGRKKHHYGDKSGRGNIHKPKMEKLYIDKLLSEGKVEFL